MPRPARIFSTTFSLIILLFFVLAATHVQAISDWYRLRGYTAPSDIASIAQQDTMTSEARHILYVTRPVLEDNGAKFQTECPQSEQSIVLGCYRSGGSMFNQENSLFVYNVNDPRLAGVQQVTMAHEMLHAAYDRLSTKERDKVDGMLTDYYNNGLKDKRIIDTINSYKQSEPNDVINEMHSIFGTEVAELPAPLEDYYKDYFTSRSAVTAFAAQYEGEFTNRLNQIDSYDQQLAQMRKDIEIEEQQLQAQLESLNQDRNRVENSNDQATINSYNSRVSAYNAGVRRLQNDITAYNQLVETRNALASDLRSLQSSLDSRLAPQSTQ